MLKKTRTIVLITSCVALFMFGFSFALAPLYSTFCKLSGIQAKLPTEKQFFEKEDRTRSITIQFTATNNKEFPWDFYPHQKHILVHPGKNTRVLFFVKNNTQHTMTVQAIPSIVPTLAILHFHKIECFCFQQQTLNAGESKNMPIVFRIDKELPRDIHIITLAYTLFDVTHEKKKRTSS